MNFKAEKCETSAHSGYSLIVDVEPSDINEVLREIDKDDIINFMGVDDLVDSVDHSEILEEIGIDKVVEWVRDQGFDVVQI